MTVHKPELRMRDAVAEDAAFLAWIMQEADRMGGPVGSLDLIFSRPDPSRLEILARLAVSETDSTFHHRRFLVAEVDGSPAAALCGYVPQDLRPEAYASAIHLALHEVGQPESEIQRVIDVSRNVRSSAFFSVQVPGDALIVEWVATRPEARGRGVMASLLAALLERARAVGTHAAHVATAIGNEPAIRAYRSAGFRIFAEARHSEFEATYGVPGLVFLRQTLQTDRAIDHADRDGSQPTI